MLKAHDENSISRQKRAALLPKGSKTDYLSLLGDVDDPKYPIYMTGTFEELRFFFPLLDTQGTYYDFHLIFRPHTSYSMHSCN